MTNTLDFGTNARDILNGGRPNSNKNEKPEAEIWMNVGKIVDSLDEQGQPIEVFVSFPWGLAFDTMEPGVARGNNAEYNQRIEAGNAMLSTYQGQLKKLKPGETVWLRGGEDGLDVEFRRKAGNGTAGTAANGDTNPLLGMLGKHVNLAS